MAVICEFEFTVNVALVPLNRTRLAPVKPTPVITTDVPITPLVGLNDVIAKPPAVTVKLVALVAVPPGVVTAIGPVVAPTGTVAVIWVFESTVKLAVVLLNFTAEAPRKPVPVTCTEVPTGPLVGSNEVIVGTGEAVTVKFIALVAVPSGFVTEIAPVVAPAGTVAVIVCVLLIVKGCRDSIESHRGHVRVRTAEVVTGDLDRCAHRAARRRERRDGRRSGERRIGAGDGDRECDKQDDQGGLGSATSHPHHDASLAVRKMHGCHSHHGLVYPP
jgi:hypothetical protein